MYTRSRSGTELIAYCDADYSGDPNTPRRNTGYVILYFCSNPENWSSSKQLIVVTSSTEAEYIAAAECCKELINLKI